MLQTKLLTKILLLTTIVVLGASGCSALPPLPGQQVAEPEATKIVPKGPPMVSATAVIAPARYSTLSMTTAGVVAEVLVEKGEHVEAGQTLVRLKGREGMQAAITGAEYEVQAAEKAIEDLNEIAEDTGKMALNNIPLAARRVRDAQYQLDNFTVPSSMEDMEAMEALDWAKEQLDIARSAFEPYRNKSSNDSKRKDLKEDLDNAQSDYNAAVRRVEYETAVEVAQADLDNARDDYEKYSQGPDPKDVELAEARLRTAQDNLVAAQSAFDDLELLAPFDGTIGDIYTRIGEWVTPGLPAILIADLEHLQVETTDLNEIDAAQIKEGELVTVSFDALDDVLEGTILNIAPKASEGSGVNYTVVIKIEDWPETLRWGMTAYVDIVIE
ncbi:HlyD family secretion protein [Chloroflexota bacterium]